MTQARGSNMHHMRGFVHKEFGKRDWNTVDPFDALMADYLQAYIHEMWTLMGVSMEQMRCRARGEVIYIDARWQ